jgi:poly(hydroxyalkanoate) depolymerase family esterase
VHNRTDERNNNAPVSMNHEFARLMAQATQLTRAGDLNGATSAIKAALVSVKAQVVQAVHPHAHQAHQTGVNQSDVIEVQARVVPGQDQGDAAAARNDTLLTEGEFLSLSHVDASGTHPYKLFVPPQALASATALPLLVMLHGCSQNPDDFAAGTRMNELARRRGWFVLYPAQGHDANASRCWNWFMPAHQHRGAGEPELIAGMVRAALHRYAVDPRRVFVAGLSAGGAMAAIVGASYPELFAAVGVHSGLPAGAASDLKSALVAMHRGALPAHEGGEEAITPPTIVIHGDQDSTVHPLNGDRLVAGLSRGAELSTEHDLVQGRSVTRRIWRDGRGRVKAEQWLVHGGGHAWSGGSTAGSYSDPSGPDASAAMLDFFSAHPNQDR